MESNSLEIKFIDFWGSFKPKEDIVFGKTLIDAYELKISNKPDILVYSLYGDDHNKKEYDNCIKICYNAENLKTHNLDPNKILDVGHYLISMERIEHLNYLRLPNIVRANFYGYNSDLINDFSNLPQKNKFCAFVQRNCSCRYRNSFVEKLSKYKAIDCAGPCLNNFKSDVLGNRKHEGNVDFLSPYKFNIAFENSSSPGYCTEKIWWGFLAKTISIYWGDPTVYQDFNESSFLNRHDFDSDDEFIEAIIELDNNDDAYYKMLTKPKLKDESLVNLNRVRDFFERIIKNDK